jgi:hypothetical protein
VEAPLSQLIKMAPTSLALESGLSSLCYWVLAGGKRGNVKNINFSYLYPSSHPSPPVPDVLPDASPVHPAHKSGSYIQESLLESSGLLIAP